MKRLLHVCDKCGKEIDDGNHVLFTISEVDNHNCTDNTIDLCLDCGRPAFDSANIKGLGKISSWYK